MRRIALFLAFSLPLAAGCATATIEDAVPVAALKEPQERPAPTPGFSRQGEYPNLNVVPAPATAQLTGEEVASKTAELRARRDRLTGGAGNSSAGPSSLSGFGGAHTDEVLRQIEGQGEGQTGTR